MDTTTRRFVFGLVLTGGLAAAGSVLALGFRNPDQDARATAQGEAFVAQADTPAAIYYNPAGLSQINGTAFTSGGYLTFRDIRFESAAGKEGIGDPAFSGFGYAASDFGLEKFTFGFGYNIPFGNSFDWGNGGNFRYRVTDTSLEVRNYAVAAAYEINDQLSFGAVLNIYDGQTELNRLVPFSILISPFVPDGRFRFDGEGQAVGATLGLLWKPHAQHHFGLVYRSPFVIDFEGHAVVKNDPTTLYGRSPATAEIEFPQSLAVGYSFRPMPNLKLEVDVEWTDWDTLDTVRLHSPNPAFATDPGSVIPFKWQSSFFYEAGAEYQLNEQWTLRGGYIFSENTVPNRTFSPTLPDSDRHVFSAGVGFRHRRFDVDVTYQYSLSKDRTVKGSADTNFDGIGDLDGEWESQAHAVMFTSTIKF
jgi:long-chain fatty acid transport protein